MKTIVALVDVTESTFKVLKYTHTLATALGSRVILLHVVPSVPAVDPAMNALGAETMLALQEPSEIAQVHKERLGELLDSLRKFGVDATALQFEGSVSDTLLAEIQRLNADLVIMGSHHHSSLYNFLVGSLTAHVLKEAPFPVLVVPVEVAERTDS